MVWTRAIDNRPELAVSSNGVPAQRANLPTDRMRGSGGGGGGCGSAGSRTPVPLKRVANTSALPVELVGEVGHDLSLPQHGLHACNRYGLG